MIETKRNETIFKKSLLAFSILILTNFLAVGCVSIGDSDKDASINFILNGNKQAKAGKFNRAQKEYELALKADPSSESAKRNLGIVYVKLGFFKDAIEQLEEVLPKYQNDPEVFYFLGEAYRALDFNKQAKNCYNRGLILSHDDTRIIKSIAWVQLKENKPKEAKETLKKLYKKNPYDIQLMLIMSNIYLKQKDYKNALKILKNFEDSHFTLASPNKELAETEKILLLETLGDAYYGTDNCQKAQPLFDLILTVRPFLATALTKSAKCDIKKSQNNLAVQKLEKAHNSDPSNLDTLFWLGQVYASSSPDRSKFYYELFLDRSANNELYTSQALKVRAALENSTKQN